jgi:hypothetical protein
MEVRRKGRIHWLNSKLLYDEIPSLLEDKFKGDKAIHLHNYTRDYHWSSAGYKSYKSRN